MVSSVRWRSAFLAAAALALGFASDGAAQATGTVEGRVTETGSGRPLSGAQVFVAGTTVGSVTNERGEYRITGAPARQVELRVRLIGYSPINRTVVVPAGGTVTQNIEVGVSALQLDQVVVTGTGAQVEVKKLGNTIATIQPPAFAPISTPSQLLQARDAGVSILPASGIAGEGSRIRIRGNASLSMSNEPIVFVDGVRINTAGGGVPAGGGGSVSRLDDIDPTSIDRVEVLKGAAAATLYGTEASNGVIQIFTKKGTSGLPRWSFNVEQSATNYEESRIKDNCGFARTDTAATRLGTFFGRSITKFEPFCINASHEILGTGAGTTANGSVQGGTNAFTYFASGRYASEDGPMDVDFLDGLTVDKVRRIQGLTNLGLVPFNSLKLGMRLSYADALQQVPQNNNNIYGVTSLAMFAKPELANCNKSAMDPDNPGRCTGAGNMYGNAAFMTVREAVQQTAENRAGRFTGVFDATYTPAENLTATATLGIDATDDRNFLFRYFRYDVDLFTGNNITGQRSIGATTDRQYTVDFKLNWKSTIMGLQSDFVAGVQGFITKRQNSGGSNTNFPGPGLEVVTAGSNPTVNESFVQTVNGGYFFQDQLGYQDWLYLTVGGRYDYASAFGENAGGVFYPKVSASIVPSDRQSWSSPLGINTVRLRAALGKSGRQPDAFAKFTTYAPLSSELGAGLAPSNLGNPDLAPEVSTEYEMGAELGVLDNRLGFDYTYWNRTVNDALIAKQFPLSGGFSALQLANVGVLDAYGHDFKVNAYLVQRANWSLDVFASAAYIKQQITSMGGAPPLKVGGSYPRYRNFLKGPDDTDGDGKPDKFWAPGDLFGAALPGPCSARPAGKTYMCLNAGELPFDSNRDGKPDTEAEALAYLGTARTMANLDPIRYDEDGDGDYLDHYLGKPYPDWNMSFGGNLSLGRSWRVNALFEYRGGNFTITNLTDAFRNSHPTIGTNTIDAANVEAVIVNPASTAQQRLEAAKTWWYHLKALSPYDGLNQNEDGSFLRLREIGVTYTASAGLAARLGAKEATFSLTGRNLFLKTNYKGVDPETNAIGRDTGGGTDGNYLEAVDAFGWPLARRVAFAIRLGY
ncbi:MAG: SusC/RagA family TonB-linked outer membrane protein [Gemmatimonadaceae bacterium]|nr:SusC/RagA family TonB-linked outer membrane protein [Gemmatimonadaceae bacterium]